MSKQPISVFSRFSQKDSSESTLLRASYGNVLPSEPALYVIKDVLTRANSWTPEAIRASLKATDLMTAFGPIKFEDREDYTNQNFMDTLVMQVINGRRETIWPVEYASKSYVYPIPAWGDRKAP